MANKIFSLPLFSTILIASMTVIPMHVNAQGPGPGPAPGPAPEEGEDVGPGGTSGFNYIDFIDVFDNSHLVPPSVIPRYEDQEKDALIKPLWGLKYARFDVQGSQGNIYGATFGWERETQKSRYGIVVPYDRIDFDSSALDGDMITLNPYYHYILTRDPVTISVGPYAIFNYQWYADSDNTSIWGGGLFGSMDYWFNDHWWVRLTSQVEYLDADIDFNSSNAMRFRYGVATGAWITERLGGRIFYLGTISDEEFFGGDDKFGIVGAEISGAVTDAFSLSLGYAHDLNYDQVEVHTLYLGGALGLP